MCEGKEEKSNIPGKIKDFEIIRILNIGMPTEICSS